MRIVSVLGLAGLCLLAPFGAPADIGSAAAFAADAQDIRSRLNDNAVTVMAGTAHEGSAAVVQDLAAALDERESLRVVPMLGHDTAQTVRDVLYLDGVDLGITQSTVLKHFAQTGELGDLKGQLVYVAKLFNEDFHLLARAELDSVTALSGKTVNVGPEGSGTEIAARIVFGGLGLDVEEVHLDTAEALSKLQSGEIDATVLIGPTPVAPIAQLGPQSGLAFLSIPYVKDLEEETYPAALGHDDYPDLIGSEQHVDTVSVSAVLVALNTPGDAKRQERLDRFVDRFFSRFDVLRQPPSHPKWREVNFAATLEGWQRAPQAQAWLDGAETRKLSDARERERFKAFLTQAGASGAPSGEPSSEAEQERLFQAFKAWSATQKSN